MTSNKIMNKNLNFAYLLCMNARSFLIVRKVTEIIFGCSIKGCKSRRSIECNEKDEGRSSLALLTQLSVCILDVKSANDEEPAAIIFMQ